ncbi:MAG TPA: recombinase family protein [Stellaceae bacterium]|nr:recombinase family protein [Stellaceae bacterium]
MNKPATIRPRRALRCAIYTRKSSEEGLEQAFNSLHAQREACEAYIKSQRHEGWTCLVQAYDDGGLSGATMDRPALQQLLANIQAGKIDVVVCYKVDRLTRSLADFAKIVEIFDQRGVSFVSVTQQFNTTTSMGRLTLNVLLSFAQFEREVTGERIRDKIAASKRKGMWMGGVPPLGYRARDHKLTIIDSEAETVRHIFRRYAALGSVRLLRDELEAQKIRSKRWTSAAGRSWGGKPLARGALYLMLQNRIYRGEIVHRDQSYPGDHMPIIDQELWDEVQAKLAANAVERATGGMAKSASLLAGLLYDGEGQRMTPTHAVKKGARYRYYVSRRLITGSRGKVPEGLRIPAGEIEQLVTARIGELLSDPARLSEALACCIETAGQQQHLQQRAAELAASWSTLPASRLRPMLATVIQRIVVPPERVDIQLLPSRLGALLLDKSYRPTSTADDDERPIILSAPAQLRRVGRGIKMVIDEAVAPGRAAKPDAKLIKLIARAYLFNNRLAESSSEYLADVAQRDRITSSYFTRVLRLSYLAPDITRAILEGRHPRDLTAQKLLAHSRLPLAWPEQRRRLGFA